MRLFSLSRNTPEPEKSTADELLSALVDTHCVAWFDANGTVLEANTRYRDMMGYDADELTGVNHTIWVTENTPRKSAMAIAMSGETPGAAVEQRVTKGGTRICV